MITNLLHIQPSELKFPVQSNKLSNCWLQLTNRTDQNVAFKVKTTHPKKYCVRPNSGIVSPGSTRVIRVGMQAQKELVQATVPKDKFLIQSMISPIGLNAENITSDMFRKERGNSLEEQKLRVVFVTANPPSPIPEVSEEEWSPEASELEKAEHNDRISVMFEAALLRASEVQDQFSEALSRATEVHDQSPEDPYICSEDEDIVCPVPESASKLEEQALEDWNTISKMIEERSLAVLENRELQHTLEMTKRRIDIKSHRLNFSVILALLVCILGFIVGYVIT